MGIKPVEKGKQMEFLAIGAFVGLFVAFVMLPKKLMRRETEEATLATSGAEVVELRSHEGFNSEEPLAATAD